MLYEHTRPVGMRKANSSKHRPFYYTNTADLGGDTHPVGPLDSHTLAITFFSW